MTRNDYFGTPYEQVLEEFTEDSYLNEMLQHTEQRQNLLKELRALREENCIRQSDVAVSMCTTQSAVSELEGEGDDIYLSTIQRYAAAVGAQLLIRVQRIGTDAHAGFPRAVEGHSAGSTPGLPAKRWVLTPFADAAVAQ